MIRIKRVFDKFALNNETRVLVDRFWPRGIKKSSRKIDLWLKNIGPSNELRKWFSHDPKKWMEFKTRYKEELKTNKDLLKLLRLARMDDNVVLVYSSSDEKHNTAVVLLQIIEKKLKSKSQIY
ncbi:MAG: DUF488 family protein [Candidatus Marsarchaeota archaeon]|nr:DUF488 family protein [Candidatus Marsarchaeota archaeon]MCL5105951.1 DUF488 family protein [Candidatus Marsarchaeota archaeon]